jgi:excisionase family DNA binding protein
MLTSKTTPDSPTTLTVDEVAQRLRLHRRTVLKLAARGEIPAVRLGKLYRFDSQKIAALFGSDAPDES